MKMSARALIHIAYLTYLMAIAGLTWNLLSWMFQYPRPFLVLWLSEFAKDFGAHSGWFASTIIIFIGGILLLKAGKP